MQKIVRVGREERNKRRALVVLFLGFVVFSVVYAPHLNQSTDDGFITYRYARNLAEGHGLVFNPGQEHLGTTAPGWAVFLAVGAMATGSSSIPVLSGLFSLLALVASLGLLCRRLHPQSWIPVLSVALVLACNRWLVEVLGHEGFAVALLALLALELMDLDNGWGAGLAWGLAFFVRPDSAVMGAVSGLTKWYRGRLLPWKILVGFSLTAAVVVAALIWLAGSAIPFSLQVKRAEVAAPLLAVGQPFWHSIVAWCERTWSWGALPLLVLSCWGWARAISADTARSLSFLIPALAMTVFFPVVGVPFAPWYFIVPLIGVVVGAAGAVSDLIARGRAVEIFVAVLLVVASVAPTLIWSAQLGFRPPDPRAEPMCAAASWLDGRSPVEGSAATVEVGFFGFASDRPVLDLMGLGSPGALKALTTFGLSDFFLEESPAFLIENPKFHYILRPLLSDPRFLARYEVVHTVPPTDRYPVAINIWQQIQNEKAE